MLTLIMKLDTIMTSKELVGSQHPIFMDVFKHNRIQYYRGCKIKYEEDHE